MDEEERQMVADAAATGTRPAAVEAAPDVEMEVDDDKEEEEEDEEEEPVRIVKDYRRPEARRPGAFDPTKFTVSPITGELVPIADMAEHMRISLIDPRWREQREAMMSKLRDTTRAGDEEIGKNLVLLARTRPDIFGSTEEEVQQVVQQSIKDSAISGNERPVVWDGHTMRGDELKAQLKAIQQSKDARGVAAAGVAAAQPPRPAVGPSAPPPGPRPVIPLPPGPPGAMPPPPRPPPGAADAAHPPPAGGEPDPKRPRTDGEDGAQ